MNAVLHDKSKDNQTAFPPVSHQSVPTSPFQTKWEKVEENWPCVTEKMGRQGGGLPEASLRCISQYRLAKLWQRKDSTLHTPANVVGAQSNIGPSPVSEMTLRPNTLKP